jgi:hypothetical protein
MRHTYKASHTHTHTHIYIYNLYIYIYIPFIYSMIRRGCFGRLKFKRKQTKYISLLCIFLRKQPLDVNYEIK